MENQQVGNSAATTDYRPGLTKPRPTRKVRFNPNVAVQKFNEEGLGSKTTQNLKPPKPENENLTLVRRRPRKAHVTALSPAPEEQTVIGTRHNPLPDSTPTDRRDNRLNRLKSAEYKRDFHNHIIICHSLEEASQVFHDASKLAGPMEDKDTPRIITYSTDPSTFHVHITGCYRNSNEVKSLFTAPARTNAHDDCQLFERSGSTRQQQTPWTFHTLLKPDIPITASTTPEECVNRLLSTAIYTRIEQKHALVFYSLATASQACHDLSKLVGPMYDQPLIVSNPRDPRKFIINITKYQEHQIVKSLIPQDTKSRQTTTQTVRSAAAEQKQSHGWVKHQACFSTERVGDLDQRLKRIVKIAAKYIDAPNTDGSTSPALEFDSLKHASQAWRDLRYLYMSQIELPQHLTTKDIINQDNQESPNIHSHPDKPGKFFINIKKINRPTVQAIQLGILYRQKSVSTA